MKEVKVNEVKNGFVVDYWSSMPEVNYTKIYQFSDIGKLLADTEKFFVK